MPTLNWIGKEAVVKHHKEAPFRLLEPIPELSCAKVGAGGTADDAAASGNLIVQGDNLHALKALLPRYAGQVKCIYIDPPYNTGNEGWVYNDNVNSPEIRRWLGEVVGKEGETLDRHDRWLCMMYPRLMLLRQFLTEDGGNRRFILVEMDENIAQNVTAERVRRVVTGYANAKGATVAGLGGGFQFCRLSAEPLFEASGQIRADVAFAQLAEFVWFAETGTGYTGQADSPLLGVHEGRSVYLLYNGILKDISSRGGNVLTAVVFDRLPKFSGPKTIYAAANRLGARTAREGVSFKQTPYALEV